MAGDGFDVVVNDIAGSAEKAQAVGAQIEELGRRSVVALGDVTETDDVKALVETAATRLGRLDVAVANAGIARVESLLDATAESWDQTFAINTRGVFLTWQAAARQFIAQGTGGKLIAAASQAAHRASGDLPAYSASKFAVRGLTQAAAQALAPHGITANSYAPGIVRTALWDGAQEAFDALSSTIPLGRAQEPEDVAALVSFLASRDSDYMTGQTVISDGGMIFA
ncbi:meso-butanediol dehydrogenase/(S,S)-butanediol dehydrogenase/diacetyl reductase [Mycobacterium sp. AZCC_0083]|nr:meso-butanediol dehydrogenase/(S,S)-butanediol dehydrogenase/diacetyl reductase [Mycobacterium sp. AZCC_0083]